MVHYRLLFRDRVHKQVFYSSIRAYGASAVSVFPLFDAKRATLILFCILLSFNAGALRYAFKRASNAKIHQLLTSRPITCIASVCAIEPIKKGAFKTRITLKLLSREERGVIEAFRAYIQLYLIRQPDFCVGDTIKIKKLLLKATKNHEFLEYLFKEGIMATAFMPFLEAQVIEQPVYSLRHLIWNKREKLHQTIKQALSPQTYALCCALFLGSKPESGYYVELKKRCNYWGIVHYLARSGLHVILILFAWTFLLRFFP